MHKFTPQELKDLYIPPASSHKGQNGKLLLIGGSHLFHAASLWALEIASKIVDMVFYASVPENEQIVQDAKEHFRNGIVVRRDHMEEYIKEADAVLIGPGMVRSESECQMSNVKYQISNAREIDKIEDEGEQTYYLTKYLLEKYPEKKWIIDAGALQMVDVEDLKGLHGNAIITPHRGELAKVFEFKIQNSKFKIANENAKVDEEIVKEIAKEYNCVVLLKGENDIVATPAEYVVISGGNAGMTKGGTGDVLAGLTAALACNNDLYLSAKAASYINKKAGESLFESVGYYFNATDLVNEIPKIMKKLILDQAKS